MPSTLNITALTVGQMGTNCYILTDSATGEALIIDPGDDGDYIIRIIQDKKIIPAAIIATHGHFDHILSVFELQTAYNIPFLMNIKDKFLLESMQTSSRHYLNINSSPPPIINKYIDKKSTIKAGKLKFIVLETPGHTPGSLCVYNRDAMSLFSGDLIFADGGVGRTDFSYSNGDDMKKSIKRIAKLPLTTNVYPGHGQAFVLKEEMINIKNFG